MNVVYKAKRRSKYTDSFEIEASKDLKRKENREKMGLDKVLKCLKVVKRKAKNDNMVRPELDIFEQALTKLTERNETKEE